MNEIDEIIESESAGVAKLPVAASLIALVGLADAAYLTVNHYTKEPVPCSTFSHPSTILHGTGSFV